MLRKTRFYLYAAVYSATLLTFILFSSLTGGWSVAWTLFLLVPIILTAVECAFAFLRDLPYRFLSLQIFSFVFFTCMYLIFASLNVLPWHPWWVLVVLGGLPYAITLTVKLIRKYKKAD